MLAFYRWEAKAQKDDGDSQSRGRNPGVGGG